MIGGLLDLIWVFDYSNSYFGYYLHHSPHSRIEAGTQNANDAWLNTLYLYEKLFDEKPAEGWLNQMSICNGGCDGAKCSPGTFRREEEVITQS